jgi:hypothetical protein
MQNRRKLIKFCDGTTFEVIYRKYRAKGEHTFVSKVEKIFHNNVLTIQGILSKFRTGNEITSSHMPLLVVMQRK